MTDRVEWLMVPRPVASGRNLLMSQPEELAAGLIAALDPAGQKASPNIEVASATTVTVTDWPCRLVTLHGVRGNDQVMRATVLASPALRRDGQVAELGPGPRLGEGARLDAGRPGDPGGARHGCDLPAVHRCGDGAAVQR